MIIFNIYLDMAAFSDVEHPWSWLYREEVKCTSCSDQINPFAVWYRHPVLNTVQCSTCNKFYLKGLILQQGIPWNFRQNYDP